MRSEIIGGESTNQEHRIDEHDTRITELERKVDDLEEKVAKIVANLQKYVTTVVNIELDDFFHELATDSKRRVEKA